MHAHLRSLFETSAGLTCAHPPPQVQPTFPTPCQILNCLELEPEVRAQLTTSDRETSLHAVPLWMITHDHMTKLLKHYRGRFTTGEQPRELVWGICAWQRSARHIAEGGVAEEARSSFPSPF